MRHEPCKGLVRSVCTNKRRNPRQVPFPNPSRCVHVGPSEVRGVTEEHFVVSVSTKNLLVKEKKDRLLKTESP